ncbi:oxidoreductase family protein [Nocardia sp. R6R-6]|uniref:oxidoreductase family protein n=1 Tax=Nocardia sp. R6R-6 TaxID=3459303 RepID=UPI00403E0A66
MRILTRYAAEEFTPENISAMLRTQPLWGDISATHVTCTPVGAGLVSSTYRLELTYAQPSAAAPSSLIAKVSSASEASRQFAVSTGGYQREVLFYRRLAGIARTRTPRCYFAEITDDLAGFVVLLEDMAPTETVDQLSGCTVEQADLALGQAAALHAPSWQHPALHAETWLPLEQVWRQLAEPIPRITQTWLDRFGAYLTPEQIETVVRLGEAVPRWLGTVTELRSLWHGDFRVDNMIFNGQNGSTPVAILDWQVVSAGPGIADVSYFLGSSLRGEDRIEHERTLVAEYHRRLTSYGVTDYSWDRCWLEYRAHALCGLMASVPVALSIQRTERGDAMYGAMAARAADQVIANESYAALQQL